MTDPAPQYDPPLKEDPQTLVLRGRPRPAVRFRRGLIVGSLGAVAAGLVALSFVALQPPSLRKATAELGSDDPLRKANADALANLPTNYGEVPRLGPPLPGDLGRPILEHQRSLGEMSGPDGSGAGGSLRTGDTAAEQARDRLTAAAQAARSSPLTVELSKSSPAVGIERPSVGDASANNEGAHQFAEVPAAQQHKIDFASAANGVANSHALLSQGSAWTLSAGTIIPASLLTGLNSDLPGTVIAQVTHNVRDSATGQTVLVPQGARLIGAYDSVVAYGQRRALLVWKRIVFPNASSIELDNMPATDIAGYSGVADRMDSHTWQLLKGIGLSTLLGVGTQLSFGSSQSDLIRAIRESAQQNAAHAGDQITSRNLDIQPTIVVRPGWPVEALLNKDLVLQPWRG